MQAHIICMSHSGRVQAAIKVECWQAGCRTQRIHRIKHPELDLGRVVAPDAIDFGPSCCRGAIHRDDRCRCAPRQPKAYHEENSDPCPH